MKVNWWEFHSFFPNYYDFKTPIWSNYKDTKKEFNLEVVAPGYEREDFNLYEEDGKLMLTIQRENDEPLVYSILGRYRSPGHDLSKAKAEYKAGILKITVPKAEESQKALPRKIEVS